VPQASKNKIRTELQFASSELHCHRIPTTEHHIWNHSRHGIFPSSRITNETPRIRDWIGSRPCIQDKVTPTQLGTIDKAILNLWDIIIIL
jgi:hypothetical protein